MVPRPRLRMDVLFFVVMYLFVSTSSQQCSQLQDNDPLIGNYTSEDRNGLVPTAFESQGFNRPVMVHQAKVVCLSPGDVRDTFKSVSIVANYSCTSASFPECDTAWSLSQFEFVCIPSANNSFQWGIVYSDGIITTPPNAGLSTDLRTDCSLCTSNTTADPDINHCIEVFCDSLPEIDNGFLAEVSDNYSVGSVASYGCDSGYNLVGVANRTCTLSNATTFWSDTEPTCEPSNGGLSPGANAGIAIAVIVVVVLLVGGTIGIILCIYKKLKRQ